MNCNIHHFLFLLVIHSHPNHLKVKPVGISNLIEIYQVFGITDMQWEQNQKKQELQLLGREVTAANIPLFVFPLFLLLFVSFGLYGWLVLPVLVLLCSPI